MALATNAHQSLSALLGQPASLDQQTGFSGIALRPFHGHITEVKYIKPSIIACSGMKHDQLDDDEK